MKNILLCIDFHDNTPDLVQKAVQLAKPFNAKLWLLHIAAPEPDFVGYSVGPQSVRDQVAAELRNEHALLNEYAEIIRQAGMDADGLLISGATVDLILEKARELDTDLIISGHHVHGFLFKLFNGSVSEQVLEKSKIPVLLFPMLNS